MSGIAVGVKKGHIVTKRDIAKPKRSTPPKRRLNFIRDVVREVMGFSPYERRVMELLKVGKEKRALKVCKKRLGSHLRARKKREEMADVVRRSRGQKKE